MARAFLTMKMLDKNRFFMTKYPSSANAEERM
jgi:hypothetical protein